MAMTLPDLLIDVCHPCHLMSEDGSVRRKALPGKTDRQRRSCSVFSSIWS